MDLTSLKNQLSSEWKKPKRDRNYELINQLHDQIKQEKAIMKKGFFNRQKEKLSESVRKKQILDAKKSAQYKKIKAEKLSAVAKSKNTKTTSKKK